MGFSVERSDPRPGSAELRLAGALSVRNVPSALVRIPGASHNIGRRPSQMLAQVLNTAAWFERHRQREGAEKGTP